MSKHATAQTQRVGGTQENVRQDVSPDGKGTTAKVTLLKKAFYEILETLLYSQTCFNTKGILSDFFIFTLEQIIVLN